MSDRVLSAAVSLSVLLFAVAPVRAAAVPDATVTVGLVLEPTNLDVRSTSGIALDQILIDNVYQGLVSRTETGSIVDTLASKHQITDKGLTYTFALRPGVTFHDGAALKASDVVWSLKQVLSNARFSGHADLAAVRSIGSPDGKSVVLKLSHPDSNLLWALSGRAGLVLEQAATNTLATSANGTGPYRLASWRQGDSVTFVRNDRYWGRKANVARVVFRYFTDGNAALNATLSGDLDVQTAVDGTLAPQLKGNSDYRLVSGRTTDKYTLAFNNAKAPLNDVRVRRALRLAIDHKAIIAALGGYGVQQGGPVPLSDPGYQDFTSVDAYNPAKARALLAAAGQSNLTLSLTIPSFYGTTVSDVLTSQLAKVGVTLKVRQVEFATWLKDVYTNHDYQLSYVNHAEARDFGNFANPKYYFGYDNPKVQALYAQSNTATTDFAARARLIQAARLVVQDVPVDWLYTATTLTALRKTISGFPTEFTSARLNLANLTVNK